jgi:hypothetical protein
MPFIVQLLPAVLAAARGAVFNGVPPYDLWEHPPEIGRIPPHRTDSGAYLVAEVFGARRMIFLKDVDGLYTCDPADHGGKAEFIPDISLSDLLARKLQTVPLDPVVLDLMQNAKLAKEIQIINGLVPGTLTRALAGESPLPAGVVAVRRTARRSGTQAAVDAASLPAPNGRALAVPAGPSLGEASRRTPEICEFDFDGLVHEVAFQIFCDPRRLSGDLRFLSRS